MGPAWHPLWDRCVAAKGEYPIVAAVRGEVKADGTYGLLVSAFCFRGPLTGLIIGYSPRCVAEYNAGVEKLGGRSVLGGAANL
jgi:hypothetical protein